MSCGEVEQGSSELLKPQTTAARNTVFSKGEQSLFPPNSISIFSSDRHSDLATCTILFSYTAYLN